ncbi:VOC family protein [Pseudoalteromonas sp. MMG006]|uniref:VOC family protein n=1 Tax=unclassified Pseudoalteromonas TaxID=194690 RepID=UPI001B3621CF|nr:MULTISPECIES: VOC family protein [unclassified Pseudoalteromonas]MBQ4800947.1 VOC family protein [Pseudoalteromonas sp. MMG006]MCH2089029.1 VOC family protein [Pseudoalteromonas sp.]
MFADAKVDHLAIAVIDLEKAIEYYTKNLGFDLIEQRITSGVKTAMKSAVLGGLSTGFTIVLLEGIGKESQVSRFVEKFGPGVQHAAFLVEDLEKVAVELAGRGVEFSTDIIRGPNLYQLFTKREENSGMMFEYIQRLEQKDGFEETNIQRLFESLEQSDHF